MRSAPKKELKTDEEPVACDICGRTILKGERTEAFLAPGGRRRTVCELCIPRADHEGWIGDAEVRAIAIAFLRIVAAGAGSCRIAVEYAREQ